MLDEIENYEINALMKYNYLNSKENWEQTRLVAYLIAQVNSKKHLELSDIINFKWDDEEIEKEIVTKEERENLIRKANQYLIKNE